MENVRFLTSEEMVQAARCKAANAANSRPKEWEVVMKDGKVRLQKVKKNEI